MDLFPATSLVRDMQTELDSMIQQGVFQLTRLLKNSETGVSSGTSAAIDEDDFAINRQKQSYLQGIMLWLNWMFSVLPSSYSEVCVCGVGGCVHMHVCKTTCLKLWMLIF